MENTKYTKPIYKCAICGHAYDEIEDRINCERKCLKKKNDEIKKAAEKKKNAEYNTRKKEVEDAFKLAEEYDKKAWDLASKFAKDYGKLPNADDIERICYNVLHSWLF